MNEITKKFKIGAKIKIIKDCGFKAGATGTINYPPDVEVIAEEFNNSFFRKVQVLEEEKIFVWIVFDEAQRDSNGDGPYDEAEISSEYFEIIN
jgi:hypothetical protein